MTIPEKSFCGNGNNCDPGAGNAGCGLIGNRLTAAECDELFGIGRGACAGGNWHVMATEPSAEMREAYPGWIHVSSDAVPKNASIRRLVITGIKTGDDVQFLESYMTWLCDRVFAGGTVKVIFSGQGDAEVSPEEWRDMLVGFGWRVISGSERMVYCMKPEDENF